MEHRDGGIYRKKCHSSGRSVQGSKMKVTEQSPWFSGEFAARVKRLLRTCLVLLCQLHRDPLRHGHELTQQQLLGPLDAEPVANLPMHLRQRHATPIRPRGKKPAAVVPGGFALVVGATPARPGSCRPASRSPRVGGIPTTAGPDTGPSPATPWPPRDIALSSAAGARTPPSDPGSPPARSCSSSNAACRRRRPHRSASPHDDPPRPSPASRATRRI